MAPSLKAGLTVVASAVFTFGLGWVLHKPPTVDLEKEYHRKMDSLQHAYDSLQKTSDSISIVNNSIRLSIDTLQSRYWFLKDQLLKQSQAYNDIAQKYKDVKRIDSFGTESIRRYYYNNFDTTKITQ